jgi:hypothetical protein
VEWVRLAFAEGRPYHLEEIFVTVPEVRESVFSTPEVGYELSREILLAEAKTHKFRNPGSPGATGLSLCVP